MTEAFFVGVSICIDTYIKRDDGIPVKSRRDSFSLPRNHVIHIPASLTNADVLVIVVYLINVSMC